MPRLLILAITLAPLLGGCAVLSVGSAAVSVASTGISATAAVGGLAVDGAVATGRAVIAAGSSGDTPGKKAPDEARRTHEDQ